MIRPLNKKFQKISIIGAGFSGLSLAYYLNQKGWLVEIFEKEKTPGGLLQSENHHLGLIESSANGILETPLVKELFLDLNIKTVKAKKESQKRYIYRDEKLKRFPLYPFEIPRFLLGLFIFSLSRLPFLKFSFIQPKKYETALQWGKRIFGRSAATWILSPILQGIYGSPLKNLSASLIFKKFFKRKKTKKNFFQIQRLIAPKNGMHDLIKSLEQRLKKKGVQIQYSTKIKNLNPLFNPTVLAAGFDFTKNFLLKELETSLETEKIEIQKKNSENRPLKEWIKNLKTLDLLSVTLFDSYPSPFEGFGVLFPQENIKALGVLNNGDIFNHRINKKNFSHSYKLSLKPSSLKTFKPHSETWIYGGMKSKEILNLSPEKIINHLQEERKKIFKTTHKPIDYKISKWPKALPLYDLNLEAFLKTSFIKNKEQISFKKETLSKKTLSLNHKPNHKPIFLTGNYLGQIGLSGILEYNKNLSLEIEEFLKQ